MNFTADQDKELLDRRANLHALGAKWKVHAADLQRRKIQLIKEAWVKEHKELKERLNMKEEKTR